MNEIKRLIHRDPAAAFGWCVRQKERLIEAEPYIATCPYWAYEYAKFVLKGRWPQAEKTIASDPKWAYWYAKDIIKGGWREAEELIASRPYEALEYATYVIKGRWPEGEASIFQYPKLAVMYSGFLGRRMQEAEEIVAKSNFRHRYVELFPEAKDDWVLKGWVDWLDT